MIKIYFPNRLGWHVVVVW